MNIELPATLTARYDPDPWTEDYYETNGSGTVTIQFGGFDVLGIRVEQDGEKFLDHRSYYRSLDGVTEELSMFVAEWLRKVFQNALANG